MAVGVASAVLASGLAAVAPAAAAPPAGAASSAAGAAGEAAAGGQVLERPDLLGAQLAARVSKARVEVVGLRDEASATFVEPDGSMVTEVSSAPRHARQGDGWVPVDLSLTAGADGRLRPKAAGFDLSLSGGGDGPAVEVLPGVGKRARWALGRLGKPKVDGSSARYVDVQPGVDVLVRVVPSGFEVSYVLTRRPAPGLKLRLPLELTGLTAGTDGNGDPVLKDGGRVLVQGAPARMWDARTDPGAEGERVRPVRQSLGASEVVLEPDAAFLADPATTFPVTVDPYYGLTFHSGTYVYEHPTYVNSNLNGSSWMRTGLASGYRQRTLMRFQVPSVLTGKKIQSAELQVFNDNSETCTPKSHVIRTLGSAFNPATVTWNTQPAVSGPYNATSFSSGATGCAASWQKIPMGNLVDLWANQGVVNNGFAITTSPETEPSSAKTFRSATFSPGNWTPTLVVAYNSYPSTISGRSVTPSYFRGTPAVATTSSRMPTLGGAATDADGNRFQMQVQLATSAADSAVFWSGTGPFVQPGATSAVTVPASLPSTVLSPTGQGLADGTYFWKSRAFDNADVSTSWSSWSQFIVDTSAPAAPSVSSSAYPQNSWAAASPPPAGSFTFGRASTNSDVVEFAWRTDDGQSGNVPMTSSVTSGSISITPQAGWRTLTVVAVDAAGNRSPETTYSFGAGGAAVTSPGSGSSTQRLTRLKAVGPAGSSGVTWSYRLQAADPWTTIPLTGSTVTVASSGAAVTAWPVTASSTGTTSSSPELLLDLRPLLTGTSGQPRDGAVQLQAAFTGGVASTSSNAPTVTLDQNGFGGDAVEQVGPGSVDLLTGNLSISATDASVEAFGSDLNLTRTFNSRTADKPGLFGPGWVASIAVDEAGSAYTTLTDTGSSVTVTDADGAALVFARTGTGGTYIAQGDAEGLVLKAVDQPTTGPGSFTLTDDDGNTTTFKVTATWPAAPTLSSPHTYPVSTVTQATQQVQQPGQPLQPAKTSYTYDAAGRPIKVLAPHPQAVDCSTSWQVGCRALELAYTTANGAQQIAKATLKSFDGAGVDQSVDVACFSYDGAGRLASAWDPRLASSTCGTPVQPTGYGYDSTGRLTTLTPPGLAPWTFSFDGPALTDRLSTVSRTHNTANGGGSETSTVRYDIPLGGAGSVTADTTAGLHPDLTAGALAAWGQTDRPVTATAMFAPGDSVPAAPTGGSWAAGSDFRDAAVTALNADGRPVNTAVYAGTGQAGWRIDTTEFDSAGRLVRTLTAGNRDRALGRATAGQTSVALPADTAEAARQLSTVQVYARNLNDPDPQQAEQLDLTDTFGPLHLTVLPDGTQVPARAHTRLSYDTGSESGHPAVGSLRLVTASTTSASLSAAPAATALTDSRTTTQEYYLSGAGNGWDLRTPLRTTTYTGTGTTGTAVTSTTLLDATGLVLETRMPSDTAGTTAGTTVHTYYTAGATNNAGCVNTAWVRLLCRTSPKAQPGTPNLPGVVSTHYTYDLLLRPTTVTETVPDSTGATVTRTTTTAYRTGGVSPQVDTVTTTGGVGTLVPQVTYGYDSASGLPTTVSAQGAGGALTTGYDDFGRTVSFTDADGATSTTAYDNRGRVASTTNPKGSTTFGYDTTSPDGGGTERRGLLTSASTSGLGGAFTASFDGGGALRTHTYPNGLTASYTGDETGDTTRLSYSKNSVEWFADSQTSNIHGQWRSHTGLPSQQTYSYDGLGRLTTVQDTPNVDLSTVNGTVAGGCTTRTYTFAGTTNAPNSGLNSNRSSRTTYNPTVDGSCQTTTAAAATSHDYDSADRLLPNGTTLAYDAFGRTTTLPAALSGASTDVTIGYYNNDLVASQSATGRTKTWQLDPTLQRFRTFTDNLGGTVVTKTNHYDDPSSDSPDWIDEGNGTASRYTLGLDGNLAATTTLNGAGTITDLRYQLTNLHGDLVTTTTPTATTYDGPVLDNDEYGNPKQGPTSRYTWLGGKQRSTDTLAGLTLMGVRLYTPTLGRFLSTDPIKGGNPNAYTYPLDPINTYDLDGRWASLIGGAAKACARACAKAASKGAKGAKWLGRQGSKHIWGPNGRLLGSGKAGNRKGWLNRGPVRVGWGWKGSRANGHSVLRIGIGWAERQQTNAFKRLIGHRHIDLKG